MTILIKSAVIIDPKSSFHGEKKDILVKNGQIEKIANKITASGKFRVIDYPDLHVSCGWFDSSVSLGEPGLEERETLETGLNVALSSGFTALAINPNTHPIIDNKSGIEFIVNKTKASPLNVYPIGALSQKGEGKELAELYDMHKSGAIAFGDYQKPIENDNLMKIGLLYAQNFNGLIFSFPKNNSIAGEGVAHEGENSTKLGLKGVPALAEHLQIARDLSILEYTGGKLHIPTISTAKSVQLIKEAKKKGLKVSCSVAAHNLVLTDDELNTFDSQYKVNPPLREEKDVKALIKGVKDGIIDVITSDHNPIDIEHKKLEFSRALEGTLGMESLFGALNKVLDLETLISLLTDRPRKVFGLNTYTINEGEQADLTLFSTQDIYEFSENHIRSTSKNAIFLGKKLKGKVLGTYVNKHLTLNS